MVSKEKIVSIRGLRKSFGSNVVFNDLDLDIYRGEKIVVLGRSGCGKSVLLKHIIGLMSPDAGEILIYGKNINNLNTNELNEVRMKFGMVFQSSALFDSLTVSENVGFFLAEHTGMPKAEVERTVAEKLELVGLSDSSKLTPSELSGGMRKRVGIARAIAMLPEVLLYDEPTTGLDPISADVINNLIVRLTKQLNVTSVIVTHDIVSASRIADRIAMIYDGKILESGAPDAIMNSQHPVIKQFIYGISHGDISFDY